MAPAGIMRAGGWKSIKVLSRYFWSIWGEFEAPQPPFLLLINPTRWVVFKHGYNLPSYRAHGLRVIIFTDYHQPAHVHVFGDGHAKINLTGPGGEPDLIRA